MQTKVRFKAIRKLDTPQLTTIKLNLRSSMVLRKGDEWIVSLDLDNIMQAVVASIVDATEGAVVYDGHEIVLSNL